MSGELRVCSGRNRPDLDLVYRRFEEATGRRVVVEKVYHRDVGARVAAVVGRPPWDLLLTNSRAAVEPLRAAGAFDPCAACAPFDLPPDLRAPDHAWMGFSAWPRVAMVNRAVLPDPARWPRSIEDLAEPRWRDAVACASMVEATTVSHFASIAVSRGEGWTESLAARLRANGLRVYASNLATREAVLREGLAASLANASNVHVFRAQGHPVEAAWLDQEEGGLGTAVDAHVVGVLRGCANPGAAREFVAFLLSEPTQALLAREFGETPVNPGADPGPVRPLAAIRRTDAPLAALIDRTPWAEAMLRRHGFEVRA